MRHFWRDTTLASIAIDLLPQQQLDTVVQTSTSAALTFGALLLPTSPTWTEIRSAFFDLPAEICEHYDALEQMVQAIVPLLLPRVVEAIPAPLFAKNTNDHHD